MRYFFTLPAPYVSWDRLWVQEEVGMENGRMDGCTFWWVEEAKVATAGFLWGFTVARWTLAENHLRSRVWTKLHRRVFAWSRCYPMNGPPFVTSFALSAVLSDFWLILPTWKSDSMNSHTGGWADFKFSKKKKKWEQRWISAAVFQISGRRRTAAEAHPRQNNVTEPIVAVIYCTLKHFPQSSPSGRSAPVRVRRHLTSKHNHCHRQKCRSSCHDNFKPPVLYPHHHQSVTQQHVQIISFSI